MVKIFHKATIKDLVGTWQYNQTDGELIPTVAARTSQLRAMFDIGIPANRHFRTNLFRCGRGSEMPETG